MLQPSGKSDFFRKICFAKIWSLISFLDFPMYGRLPNMNS